MADEYDAIREWAFTLLTMRVNTPWGEWLPDDFEQIYIEGWREAVDKVGEDAASDTAILTLANIAADLVQNLAIAGGATTTQILESIRRDHIDVAADEGDEE